MGEVSESYGLKEEDEIELDLGLSIGGSFGKPGKLKPVKKIHVLSVDSKSDKYGVDVKERHPGFSRPSESRSFAKYAGTVDSQAKREMHALRRYEAKKKREEKQQQKRGRERNGQSRNEFQIEEEPACKKERTDYGMMNVNLNASSDDEMQMLLRHRQNDVTNPVPVRALAAMVQYPYTPVQYVPFTNTNTNGRLGLPCVMPCRFPVGGGLEPSAPCQTFGPYKGNQLMPGVTLSNGCKLELNGEKDGRNRKTESYSSPICCSSGGSEDRSSSHEGGVSGGSDSRSRSTTDHSSPEKLQGQKANHSKGQSEHSSSSELVESDTDNSSHDGTSIPMEKVLHSDITAHQPSRPARPVEEAMPGTEAKPSERHILNAEKGNPNCSVKNAKTNMAARKPPKPKTGNQKYQNNRPSDDDLPKMPYVSTTGNGPNGKTITGFLYRYTKSEVSIICVCHGSSFSPAEFVQHAGGTDVSHPLKHITVIPSAFG